MNEIQEFLSRGKSVCPFAQTSTLHFAESGSALVRAVKEFAETLGATPAHALVVGESKDTSSWGFVETKAWAIERFMNLFTVCSLISGVDLREALEHARCKILPMFDDECPTRPILGLNNQPLFTICMAPVYPETHPRYAPRPIVVVTWGEDVANVQALPKVLAAIRDKMRAWHGSLYDADELMVPLPKEVA